MQPRFVIIGAQRGGTTSLYSYLTEHPLIVPALKKEVHFFDNQFAEGAAWYGRQFASRFPAAQPRRDRWKLITGEATPYYLFHPLVPARVARTLPGLQLIAILRNPIERAISHYHHQVRRQHETLAFGDAIDAEATRLAGEAERMRADESYRSLPWQYFSYRARGCYLEQIERWLEFFPRKQMLFLISEDFYADPSRELRRCTDFLGLPPLPEKAAEAYQKFNQAAYTPMPAEVRARLAEFYRPHNARLAAFLGRALDWDRVG